ncbi:MAG: hypothetical protein QF634_16110 [Vicinamibacterales bacterium]|nr:hypothetical protein [Vicinamibacterales bacterium]
MRVQAVHGVAIRSGDEVAVDIDRHLHGAVPELLLHVGQGFPLLNQQTGKGVPQVVETDASKFRPLQQAIEHSMPQVVPVDRVSVRREEHPGSHRGTRLQGRTFPNCPHPSERG